MLSIAIKPKGFDEDEESGYGDDDAMQDAARDVLAAVKKGDSAALADALRTCCALCMEGDKRAVGKDEESDTYE